MKYRICSLIFNKDTKIQINDGVKVQKSGSTIIALELGSDDSYDKLHWIGVISSTIDNIKLVKNNIKSLEEYNIKDRIKWFNDNIKRAAIIKIEYSKLFDKLNNDGKSKDTMDYNVYINSAVQLR